ncbi:unnamed protein product [Meganyctiphanes norvegica]|uniref:Protein slit n=1 Tax=Meganyctiphanes norvegica TaxID=48144 RepID=A0AAV2QRW2_MEGNR
MGYLGVRALVGAWAWLTLLGALPNNGIEPVVEAAGPVTASSLSSVTLGSSCPARCACFGTTVDCAKRGLTRLPRGVPPDTQRLDLQGNELTAVYYSDLAGLHQLRILQLHENKIHTVERGAFQDLSQLERLRLDHNKLQHLPDNLFLNCPSLYKLELSRNNLKIVGKKLLKGLTQLRYLQLDENEITCIDEHAFKGLSLLEILTLTNNNVTTLWQGTFEATPRLRALRVSGNKLICDCNLSWLGRWLAAAPHLAPYVRCSSPYRLKDRLVTDVTEAEFKCTGLVSGVERGCSLAPVCPRACRCGGGIVDCRDTGQTHVPTHIPDDTIELRLEHNEIRQVPSNIFTPYRLLKRIDLSNNEITEIADEAFHGLTSLNSLVLYGNKMAFISPRVFRGLKNLQLLLLNANQIACVHPEAFRDLRHLSLLSLYDNQIMTMNNGTFDPLVNIQTMHLGANPFVCDCKLGWLGNYLAKNPIETSGARCQEPAKLGKKPFGKIRIDNFKCNSELRSKYAGRCDDADLCPDQCTCEGTRVDCSGRDLTGPPTNLPPATTHLDLSYNQLFSLDGLSSLSKLKDLVKLDLSHNRLTTFNADVFRGARTLMELDVSYNKLVLFPEAVARRLKNLAQLHLAGNHISCLSQKILQHLPKLEILDMSNNPLNCDCRSAWLGEWVESHEGSPFPTCQLPTELRGEPLSKLSKGSMNCKGGEEEAECVATMYCPPECQCKGTIVHCSRGRLTDIPRGIPPDTQELYLDMNEIKVINPERLRHLQSLKRLDLSNNQITLLPNNTFFDLTQLSTLIISYNKLGCLERDALLGLKSLRILSLHGNDVSFIPDGTFRDFSTNTHIALGANPLYCDCSMAWLAKWVKGGFVEPGIARCHDPRPMRDKLVLTTPAAAFTCGADAVPDEILAKCDLCYTHPCKNGGTCRSGPGQQYECLCAPGYHGSECQYKIDACYGTPCDNGATCKVFETGRYECHCPTGYEGGRCEVNIDDCAINKCENGAACVDGVSSYSCTCPEGFSGEYCEKKITYCTKEFNPCKNEAACIDHGSGYECQCARGWAGANCTENMDDCTNHMCQNGGQCVDGIGDYECKCVGDWTGRYCELGPSVLLQTEACLQRDCQHGVCVVPKGEKEYVCKCSAGYSGKYCEYLTSVNYIDSSSFVQLLTPKIQPSLNITLTFSTKETNGVLVYHGKERKHIAVEVFKGRLRISYDVGNHPASTMFSYEMVSDENEHTVELLLVRQNFTLRVDGGISRSMMNAGEMEFLEVETPVFLGGVPADVGKHALGLWQLRNISSFQGCMSDVKVNRKLQDLSISEKQNKVVPGCGEAEQRDEGSPKKKIPNAMRSTTISKPRNPKGKNICENSKCDQGECRPRRKGTSYRCRCKKGWTGKYCDIGPPSRSPPTCKKEPEKAYVYDYGCRSRRRVRQFTCKGTCGQNCCQPKRYRKKKVSMICNDGTKYDKDVDIVRKCRCSRDCSDP